MKGKDAKANQYNNNNEKPCNNGKGICFRARDNGTCDIPNCQYDHDREKLREARRNMQMSNELSKALAAYGFEPNGKGKGKGKGKRRGRSSSPGKGKGKVKAKGRAVVLKARARAGKEAKKVSPTRRTTSLRTNSLPG